MADIIREAVIRISLEQVKAKLEPPDLTPLKKATEEAKAEAQKAAATMANTARQTAETVDRAAKQQVESVSKVVDANLRANEAFKAAGEGAFTFARGVAFLVASSDEDLQKLLKTVAAFQGGFDIFKGGVEIIKGVTEANRALAAASSVAAVAETAKGTAIAGTGAAAAAATPALIGFQAATGPVGIAILGVGAALATGVALWRQYAGGVEEATEAEYDFAEARRRSSEGARDQLANIKSIRDAQLSLTEATKERNRLEQGVRGAAFGSPGDPNNPFGARPSRGLLDDPDTLFNPLAEQAGQLGRVLELDRQRLDMAKAQLIEAEKLGVAREQLIEKQQRAADLATKELEAEQAKVRSIQAQVGALSELESAELNRLANKVKAGEDLSRAELQKLNQLGGQITGGFVEQQFANRGAGQAEALAKIFGIDLNARQADLQNRARDESRRLDQLTDGRNPADVLADIRSQRDEAIREAEGTVQRVEVAIERVSQLMDRFIAVLDKTYNEQFGGQ